MKTFYQKEIRKILDSNDLCSIDPRHIEAFLLLDHGTLSHLSSIEFKRETVGYGRSLMTMIGNQDAELLAQSFGL